MRFFKKKQIAAPELKCPAVECSFTCNDPKTMKKHTDWKHPELVQNTTGKVK